MSDEPATIDDALRAVLDLSEKVGKLNRKLKKMRARCRKQHGDHECMGFKVEQDPDEDDEIDRTEVCGAK
jgi:hypothetical protein